jgi:hypothetical protein
MNTIKEIVEQLPYIMTYFVEGYFFIMVYKYIVVKKIDSDTKNLFLKCVIASFVIKNIVDLFLGYLGITVSSNAIYIIVLSFVSLLLGYICGKLAIAKWFQNILFKLGIQRTPNDRIWDDVLNDNQECWVCLKSPKEENVQYLGLYKFCEEFAREPIIALSYYQVLDMEGDIIDDQSKSNNVILLNTKDFEKVEIIYGEKVGFISTLKRKFCSKKKK